MGLAPEATIEEFVNITVSSIVASLSYQVPYTPTYLEGSSGAGKSTSINYIMKGLQAIYGHIGEIGYFQFKAGTQTAQELWGVPFPVDINDNGNIVKVSKYLKNEEFPGVIPSKTQKIGIFHIDELTSMVDDQIKSAVTELILEGKMADYTLPPGWFIVCTGNEKKDGNVYNKLLFPMRNRLRIMKIMSTKEGWLDWAKRNNIDQTIYSFIANTLSQDEYLTFNPDLEDDGDDVDPNNYVAATQRSWAKVDYIIKNVNIMMEKYGGSSSIKIPGGADIDILGVKELAINFQSLLGKDLGTKFYDYYMATFGLDVNKIINAEWENGIPKEKLDTIQNRNQLDYLVAQAKNSNNILTPTKVIFYLDYIKAPESYITTLQSSLTKEQQDALKNYAIDTNSLNIVNTIVKKGENLDKISSIMEEMVALADEENKNASIKW